MAVNMQKNTQNKIKLAMIVPGWPMSACPNGIVTYVHNISSGFGNKVKLIVFTHLFKGIEIKDSLINLSTFSNAKNIVEKLFDRFLYQLTFSYARPTQYKRTANANAQKIHLGLKQLSSSADIIEMEESFGIPIFLQQINNIPVVTRLHGPWFLIGPILHLQDKWDYQLRVFYEGETIKNSHGVTSPSLDVLNKVREYYGLELPDAKVIPNPVIEVPFHRQWQYDSHKEQSILFVGRFDSVKGGDVILEAFRIVALKNSTIELIFVGPDNIVTIDNNDLNFNAYVDRFIPEESIKNRIRFLGHCDQKRIEDLRKNALVTVVCSRYENFPLSLLESLAAGCPTVATAVGGMKEIIVDDFNGLLAEPESAESIAEKVLSLIADPEKMQRLSKNAIEDCKKRFSPEVVAAQTLAYYESVLARVSETSSNMKN